MSILNFGELRAAVENSLAAGALPNATYTLMMAELNSDLRLRQMETEVTLVSSGGRVTLPTDFLQARSAYLDSEPRQPLDVVTGWTEANDHQAQGRPKTFRILGTEAVLSPTPDGSDSVVLHYVARMADFLADADSNAVLQAFPQLFVYSALKHGAIYRQDMELANMYGTVLQGEKRRVEQLDKAARYPGPLRPRARASA